MSARDLNLLDPALRRTEPPLSARQLAIAWGLAAVAMALWIAVTRWERVAVAEQEAALQRQVDAGRVEITTLAGQLAARQASPALAADIVARRRDLSVRQAAVDALERGGDAAIAGPGPVLRAFARGAMDGVWLTALVIGAEDHRIGAAGRTLDAALIPVWLERLGRDEALRGRAFDHLTVASPDAAEANRAAAGAAVTAARPAFVEFFVGSGLAKAQDAP
ncbi:MAG: hypothetical protein MUF30_07510 [Burkholderiales bacterium]|nr:hypothetical protein [Burkholderiales bacterium]